MLVEARRSFSKQVDAAMHNVPEPQGYTTTPTFSDAPPQRLFVSLPDVPNPEDIEPTLLGKRFVLACEPPKPSGTALADSQKPDEPPISQ